MEITFLGQCGFYFDDGKLSFMIDPVLTDLAENGVSMRNYPPVARPEDFEPDFVFCTHDHIDHLCTETVKRIAASSGRTVFVIPEGCAGMMRDLGITDERLMLLSDGKTVKLMGGELEVSAFSAAHPVHSTDENGKDHNLIYSVLYLGKRYVHLGDTYRTERLFRALKSLGKPDILFAPINGRDEERESRGIIGNLDSEEAVSLACDLGAGLLVPTHFDMIKGNTADIAEFTRIVEGRCPFAIPRLNTPL